jgi:DNA-binding NarL/FixJ family response regulator
LHWGPAPCAPAGGESLIRLGVVDDHPVFRLGLVRMLERETDMVVHWDVGSLDAMHQKLEAIPVEVVLLDLNLGPGEDALGAITAIRKTHPTVKVIVVSASLDWEAANAAREAGANGYLPKDLEVQDMIATIRALASPNFGRWSFNEMLSAGSRKAGTLVALRGGLTRRERQVLLELRRGRTNKEIATRLGVSISTINKHVQHILKKLRVRTRTQAVALVNADVVGKTYQVPGTPR